MPKAKRLVCDDWLRGDNSWQHPHLIRDMAKGGDIVARVPNLANARAMAKSQELLTALENVVFGASYFGYEDKLPKGALEQWKKLIAEAKEGG